MPQLFRAERFFADSLDFFEQYLATQSEKIWAIMCGVD
jgi:hypothetical protein